MSNFPFYSAVEFFHLPFDGFAVTFIQETNPIRNYLNSFRRSVHLLRSLQVVLQFRPEQFAIYKVLDLLNIRSYRVRTFKADNPISSFRVFFRSFLPSW